MIKSYAAMPISTRKLANSNLGRGALRSIFQFGNDYQLIMRIEDGELLGFALYHYEEFNYSNEIFTMGVVDCVVVDEQYRRMGIGASLTFTTLKKMAANGVKRIEMFIKEPGFSDRDGEPGVPLASPTSMLELLGFKKVKVFHNYYENISLKLDYQCKLCGNYPDTCRAILYSKSA